MKIFEVTKLKEAEVDPALFDKIKKSIAVYKQSKSNNAASDDADSGASAGGAQGSNPNKELRDIAQTVRSGKSQLSKDIDAILSKPGIDAQSAHMEIMSKIQNAAGIAATHVITSANIKGRRRTMFTKKARMVIRGAAFGYINKKHLGGSDTNYKVNTKDMIEKILQSKGGKQQAAGGQQATGRQRDF